MFSGTSPKRIFSHLLFLAFIFIFPAILFAQEGIVSVRNVIFSEEMASAIEKALDAASVGQDYTALKGQEAAPRPQAYAAQKQQGLVLRDINT